jgi:hypothetical protein
VTKFFKNKTPYLLMLSFLIWGTSDIFAQGSLTLDEVNVDENSLNRPIEEGLPTLDMSELEEVDDLESLKSDIGDVYFEDTESNNLPVKAEVRARAKNESLDEDRMDMPSTIENRKSNAAGIEIRTRVENDNPVSRFPEDTLEPNEVASGSDLNEESDGPQVFEVGEVEQNLLKLSRYVEGKIPASEWSEIADSSRVDKYVVQEGDWLWKISQQLFGTGFYYSKIWSLNPHITNPHEIEPGMTLVFDSGSSSDMPEFRLGEFEEAPNSQSVTASNETSENSMQLSQFGDNIDPNWLKERQELIEKGVFFQYASEETYDDLKKLSKLSLNKEYERYTPPPTEILIKEPGDVYDELGFDKNSRIQFDVKDGFYLNTFVTTNIVQDLGEIKASPTERVFLQRFDRIYVEFGPSVKVKPGDKFSVYSPEGKVSHSISDREGFRYTILAQVEVVKKINDVWECEIIDSTGTVERGHRLTVYTPRIEQILQTFNPRNIEAALIDSFRPTANGLSFGDVVYIDRGRADGVEMGNVFELYSFMDRGTGRRITIDPTYEIGEITVITLTDNFATALVSRSMNEIPLGTIALSKSVEQAAIASKVRKEKNLDGITQGASTEMLEELDVELNLDDYSKNLLEQADSIELTEDELEELERQERERSIISDQERDLRELERLEQEIIQAETKMNEAKVDEDKFLEQHDLNKLEGKIERPDADSFHSLNEIEQDVGRKYLDEDLNEKENPYGLTEYDLEEIDMLLESESKER